MTGAVGPRFYAMVTIEKSPVEAMVDPGSSATIISFERFKKIGQQARIPSEELLLPDITLQDYNQRPIPIGACTKRSRAPQTRVSPIPTVARQVYLSVSSCCTLGKQRLIGRPGLATQLQMSFSIPSASILVDPLCQVMSSIFG